MNSIYNPTALSQFGINNFASASSNVPVDLSALGPCVQGLFGVGLESFTASQPGKPGSFTGVKSGIYTGFRAPDAPGPFEFSVVNDVSKTQGTLNFYDKLDNPGQFIPGQIVKGYTRSSNPFRNYTAREDDPSEFLPTQIKELGNSLGIITNRTPAKVNENPGPGNNEPGTALLNCYNRNAFAIRLNF
ncbi:MAG: hypothetical protein WA857_12865 [Candidatus Acidiferrum sp.]